MTILYWALVLASSIYTVKFGWKVYKKEKNKLGMVSLMILSLIILVFSYFSNLK